MKIYKLYELHRGTPEYVGTVYNEKDFQKFMDTPVPEGVDKLVGIKRLLNGFGQTTARMFGQSGWH